MASKSIEQLTIELVDDLNKHTDNKLGNEAIVYSIIDHYMNRAKEIKVEHLFTFSKN